MKMQRQGRAWVVPVSKVGDADTATGEESRTNANGNVGDGFEKGGSDSNALPSAGEDEFVVVSYNILADGEKLALSSKHGYCPMALRVWGYRMPLLLEELVGYDADVLCLQEVLPNAFDTDFAPRLKQAGYTCFHATHLIKNATANRFGPMLAVKQDAFEVIKVKGEMFSENVVNGKHTGKVKKKLHSLTESCIIALLEHRATKRKLVTTSIHLHWDPQYPHIKVAQIEIACKLVQELVKANEGCSVLLCGDFNSLPHYQPEFTPRTQFVQAPEDADLYEVSSGVYRLLKNGVLEQTHPEHPDVFGKTHALEDPGRFGTIRTELPPLLDSYRSSFHWNEYRDLVTTKTDDFLGILDYIFYHNLNLSRILEIPRKQDLEPIPDASHPSDHLAIGCRFTFPINSEEKADQVS